MFRSVNLNIGMKFEPFLINIVSQKASKKLFVWYKTLAELAAISSYGGGFSY